MAKKILFVDDEPEFVRPQVRALEDAGYAVTLEMDPDRAITLLQRQKFALIILDLIMPPRQKDEERSDGEPDYAETGVKLHQEIRDELKLKDIPIVFLTVVRDQDIRREIWELEREYGHKLRYLRKPVSSSDVVIEVQRALGDPQNAEFLNGG
jgi:CheY-like chemotaxis protein